MAVQKKGKANRPAKSDSFPVNPLWKIDLKKKSLVSSRITDSKKIG